MVEPIEGCDDIYLVDVMLFDTKEVLASYIVDAERTAIIDTGVSTRVGNIFDAIDELGIEKGDVDYIAPTHVHLDHAGGTGHLAEECRNATVICHKKGVDYLTDPDRREKLLESSKRVLGD
ncbi:MAG: MBL fold metallo-hydrolase, partial [Halobacteria archaeon]|nr:MBL fold metallo-hydrolase [Halobacteria archaeon]